MLLILLSSIPILWVGDHLGFRFVGAKQILAETFPRPWRPVLTGFLGIRLENVIAPLFWPLFLFGVVKSFTNLGALTSVFAVVEVALMVVAGRVVDSLGSRRVFKAIWPSRSNSARSAPLIFWRRPSASRGKNRKMLSSLCSGRRDGEIGSGFPSSGKTITRWGRLAGSTAVGRGEVIRPWITFPSIVPSG